MTHDLVLGLDSSTTACKAIVWDRRGGILAQGRAALTVSLPAPGWHEQNAEDWWSAACQAIRQSLAGIDPRRLAALSIAHQRESFVPLD
jgi:xylulokinase